MTELLHFLQTNFQTLLVLLTGAGAVTSAYLYKTRHYRRGHKTGKGLAKRFREPINKKLISPHSQKSMRERIEMLKEEYFQLGLGDDTKIHNQTVSRLEEQIGSFKNELEVKKERTTKEYSDKGAKLEQEVHELETNLKIKEGELFLLKREEGSKNESLEQDSKIRVQKAYYFSGKIEKKIEALDKVTQRLELDLLKYVHLILIGLLLAGDYIISLYIFKEFLKIIFRSSEWIIYVVSGMLALIYLIYLEQLLDLFERPSEYRKNKPRAYLMIVVGLILLILYAVLISMSTDILDFLFRLMFIPLIVGVTLTIRKVQKNGGFAFAFTPIKVIYNLILIAVYNVMLVFEIALDYISKYLQKERFESKTKKIVEKEIENIKLALAEKSSLRVTLEQKLEADINKLSEHYQGLINKLEEKIEGINVEITEVRKGFESGFVSALKLPDQS